MDLCAKKEGGRRIGSVLKFAKQPGEDRHGRSSKLGELLELLAYIL